MQYSPHKSGKFLPLLCAYATFLHRYDGKTGGVFVAISKIIPVCKITIDLSYKPCYNKIIQLGLKPAE